MANRSICMSLLRVLPAKVTPCAIYIQRRLIWDGVIKFWICISSDLRYLALSFISLRQCCAWKECACGLYTCPRRIYRAFCHENVCHDNEKVRVVMKEDIFSLVLCCYISLFQLFVSFCHAIVESSNFLMYNVFLFIF